MDVLETAHDAGEQAPRSPLGHCAILQDLVKKVSTRSHVKNNCKSDCLHLPRPKDAAVTDDVLMPLDVDERGDLPLDGIEPNVSIHLFHRNRGSVPATHALDGAVGPLAEDAVTIRRGQECLFQVAAQTPEVAEGVQYLVCGRDSLADDEPARSPIDVGADSEPRSAGGRDYGYDNQVRPAGREVGAGHVSEEQRSHRVALLPAAHIHTQLQPLNPAWQTKRLGSAGRSSCHEGLRRGELPVRRCHSEGLQL
mmetsp:Transcript_94523/g.282234  ORF Transcript_94523/g.282234 Transcript_94523/m.282234 type:complete len:252 (-) Transcript_94523:121-876(-)